MQGRGDERDMGAASMGGIDDEFGLERGMNSERVATEERLEDHRQSADVAEG